MIKWLFHIVVFILCLSSCEQKSNVETTPILYPELEVSIDNKAINAGTGLELSITQKNQRPLACTLHLSNGLVSYTQDIPSVETQKIIFNKSLTQVSGYYELKILSGYKVLYTDSILIKHSSKVDHLDVYNGPKSIPVDQTQQSMTVVVPEDVFGNPVKDGSQINYALYESDGNEKNENRKTENLISYQINEANTNAKDVFIGISQNATSSNKQKTISIPSWPNSTNLKIQNFVKFANNRDFFKLSTDWLRDQFGNTVADGTLVHFYIEENGNRIGLYNGMTIDGQAFAFIKNPSRASRWNAYANIGDNKISKDLSITFVGDLKNIPHRFVKNNLIVGPLIGQLGQFIADGSQVKIKINEQEIVRESFDGMAQFELDELKWIRGQEALISVSGIQKRVKRNE